MENKKPLIIVPPMTEPMIKLKEILEGIAVEENIEIFTVEDAKEFTQLLGSGGQALVMMSNAKLCATLLQDNKNIIAKNHSKVILLTPKEIPIKTLEKFRKIGLTESILESTAPKTLLYKVKLQLKSIKLTIKEENNQQVIKAMLDTSPKMKVAEDELIHPENNENSSEITENEDNLKKINTNDEENTLDYLGNLKGKKTKAEDAIETHWKSKRDNKNIENSSDEDIYAKPKIELDDDIDMYYRGKTKKNNELEIENTDDIYKKNKTTEELELEKEAKKKKQLIEEESSTSNRKKNQMIDNDQDDDLYTDKKDLEENAEDTSRKKEKSLIEEDSIDLNLDKKEKHLAEEEEESKRRNSGIEIHGGHTTGKVSNNELELEFEKENDSANKITEEDEESERPNKTKLEDVTAEKEASAKKMAVEESKDPSEGKVDHIDNYLRGNAQKTADIMLQMSDEDTSKNKMHEEDEAFSDKKKDSNLNELEELEDEIDKKHSLEDQNSKTRENKSEQMIAEEERSESRQEKMINTDEETDLTNANKHSIVEDDGDLNKKSDSNEKIEPELNSKESTTRAKEEDLERKKTNSTNLDLEKSSNLNHHAAQVDKISTYYRSGENNNKDQNWDIPIEKKSTTLDIEKTKQIENLLSFKKNSSNEEITIDYRKLKEEFEQLSKDGNSATNDSNAISSNRNEKDYSSVDQYKVVELAPHAFDFAIEVLNLIYQSEIKPNQIVKTIAEKLLSEENAIMITYQYKLIDKKYTESYSAFNDLNLNISQEMKDLSEELIKDKSNLDYFHTFSMPIWMCRSIPEKDGHWKDFDLPSWAKNELTNKTVEYVCPFFDGVDRMGLAYLIFPKGITPQNEKKIIIIVEMLRTIFLDTIQRSSQSNNINHESTEEIETTTNKVTGFFGNLFGKKKTG